ncbi:MAG TPA: tetratricopeptide repeat protein [Acidobacteriaceae bacterium]|nr:tetratricopeptide repeat protein [Acidobacteriaceae bacterium]
MAVILPVAGLAFALMLGKQSAAGQASPADPYQQGQAAFAAHRFPEAAAFFARADSRNPGQSDALLMEAKSLANADRFAESDRALRAYLDRHPGSSDAFFMLGFVLNRENRAADSLKVYTQAARLATPKSDDLKVVALDYVLLDDYPDAIHWMEKAVVFDPQNEEAWYGLGRCYYSQSRFADAERAFRQALALNALDVKAEANLGLAYEMDNRPGDAEHAYKAAVTLANNDPHTDQWPYLDYGSFLLEHNRPADALPPLGRAVAVAPGCAECHGKLGRALTLTGKANAGIAELRKAVNLAPRDPKLHYDLGRAYRAAGQMDQAKAEMDLSAKLYGSKDTAPPQ